jgi:diacylglycerol O-acyltransferase / wax synthase
MDGSPIPGRAEPLSRADAAWLHMEQATNHFVVTSLLVLEERLDMDRLRDMLRRKLPALPLLGQRAVEPDWPLAPPRWEDDANFELDAHLHRVALPAPGGREQLEELIGDLAGQPVDLQRPPWQVNLIEDYNGGSAVITRLHHCLGDGAALVQMLQALADTRRRGWLERAAFGAETPEGGRFDVIGQAAGAVRHLLSEPGRVPGVLRSAVSAAGTLARLSLLDPDPPTALRAAPGVLKRAAWSDPLQLARVRSITRATGSTVNDVLVSIVAGGLGAYLRERDGGAHFPRIRAMVPVDLRPRRAPVAAGNRFSLVLLELPIAVRDARERLMRVKIEMDRIKASNEAQVGWVLVSGLGLLPAALERPAARFFADKATLVLTNVIGPRRKLYLAGSPIRSQTFWEPQSGGLGLGVSIFSYAGEVILGAVADARSVPRPRELVTAFERSFEELARAV